MSERRLAVTVELGQPPAPKRRGREEWPESIHSEFTLARSGHGAGGPGTGRKADGSGLERLKGAGRRNARIGRPRERRGARGGAQKTGGKRRAMPRTGRKRAQKARTACTRCGLAREPWETFTGGLCPKCHHDSARKRRRAVGDGVLARAKDGGIEQRGGQEFRVVVLPAGRRRR
jgi:hypothetical protein